MVALMILATAAMVATAANAKSIDEFTQQMEKKAGFFTFYHDDATGKVYLEVARFNQPFMFQSSLPRGLGSNDIGLDRGQLGQTRLAQFERYGNKVMLKQLNTYYRADGDNLAEKQSVTEAFASSVIAGFTVAAGGEKGQSVLIDYTDFLLSDVHGVSRRLKGRKQGSFSIDAKRSAFYPPRSKSFIQNTELEALITFSGSKPGEYVRQVSPDAHNFSVHMHHSFIQLPDDNYQPRVFHPFSGFMSVEMKDYAVPLNESMTKRFIPRHRLEKKDPNAAISEAVEPIVYYLDPGVPEPVRSALLDGASWWNQAYEAIGFRNAFQVKILPADADPMDVRYNVIQWVHRATRGWSYGYSVVDPRTGEIVKGHVTLGSLRVRQDLLIAQGMTGAAAEDQQAQLAATDMALDRIRQLSAHEVGHTIGIAHNFAASGKNRASVMDYPHPLFELDDNGDVVVSNAYDKDIGVWDKHAIAYGYGVYDNEAEQLANIIATGKQAGLEFISDADARVKGGAHPTGHLWDNGKNAADELNRMVDVREVALQRFDASILNNGDSLSQLEERLVPVYLFHRFQVEAAAKLIAGESYEYEVKSDNAVKGRQVVSVSEQQKALDAILATVDSSFLTLAAALRQMMVPKSYGEYRNRESFKNRTSVTFDSVSIAEAAAGYSINLLLNNARLNRLAQQQASTQASNKGFGVSSMLNQLLAKTVKVKPANGLEGQIQQRLTHVTIELLMQKYQQNDVAPEVKAIIADKVIGLSDFFASQGGANAAQLNRQIEWFTKTGQWTSTFKLLPLPPGSPI